MSAIKYLDKSGLTYFWGKVKGIVSPKADKSEMSVTPGTGDNADKTTIQLKSGTSATVLTAHQDLSGKMDKVNAATSGHLSKFNGSGQVVDGGDTADYAKNLVAPVVQSDAEVVYRKTGGNLAVDGAGGAVLQKIKGKTLVWNQLIENGNFASTDGWGTVRCSITAANNVATLSYTEGDGSFSVSRGIALVPGHKYLAKFTGKASSATLRMRISNAYGGSDVMGQKNTNWQTISSIWTSTAPLPTVAYPRPYVSGAASGDNIQIKDFVIFDLTLMFGAGNEPSTVAEFETMFPEPYYDYNPGKLISNDASAIETVGFNRWDEEWENGDFDSSGAPVTQANKIRSKNFIPIIGGADYYFKTSVSFNIFLYDSGHNLLYAYNQGSGTNIYWTAGVHNIPSGVAYLRFSTIGSFVTTYNHDICINLSDPAKNGTYEPYKKTITTLNLTGLTGKKDGVGESVVVFPEGLRRDSSGTLYDEISGNKAIKRLGAIDLGTPTWSKVEYYNGGFYATIPSMKAGGVSRIICSKYIVNNGSNADIRVLNNIINANNGNLYSDNSHNVFVRDSSAYDTLSASEFKASMSGVILYYELATPEEYILDSTPDYTYPVYGDGTERRLPEDTSSSVHAPFRADILYALNGSATLRNLDANYVRNDNIKQDTGNNENTVMSQAAVTREINGLTQRIINVERDVLDLSFFDPIEAAPTMKRNTANTYVIFSNMNSSGRKFRFPLVYGNGIKNGKPNPAAYTRIVSDYTADFVNHLGNTITDPWIERNMGCTINRAQVLWGTILHNLYVKLADGWDGKYVEFEIPSSATSDTVWCVALLDSNNNILWSWDIWYLTTVTNLKPETIVNHTGVEYKMMHRPLCSIMTGTERFQCAYYQWGRKDIMGFPAAYNSSSLLRLYQDGDFFDIGTYGVADDSDAGGTVRSVANSIKMPDKFFLEYDNTNYNWNNLPWFNNFWNAAETLSSDLADNQLTAIKTIYDPCPVGYMLPAGRFATGFTTSGSNESDATKFNVVGEFANGWNFKKNSADAVGAYWPASGYRSRTSGGLDGVGGGGSYWSSAPGSQTGARGLLFGSGYVSPLYDGYRAPGFSVRPSVELT